jgi:predicted TIM-barrel fold metal-dependent hydrolase
LECIQYWIEERNFKGVKLYPPLGYAPGNPMLAPIFAYCERQDVPVLTHCSAASARAKCLKHRRLEATRLASPTGYLPVLERHPKLRLCLGHFGGVAAWAAYRRDPRGKGEFKHEPTRTWLNDIRKMIANERYAHLYTDISYTLFADTANVRVLKILLQDDRLRSRTLFGSDFYMSRLEEQTEREHSQDVHAALGGEVFAEIAEHNPKRYLGPRLDAPVTAVAAQSPPAPQPCRSSCQHAGR